MRQIAFNDKAGAELFLNINVGTHYRSHNRLQPQERVRLILGNHPSCSSLFWPLPEIPTTGHVPQILPGVYGPLLIRGEQA